MHVIGVHDPDGAQLGSEERRLGGEQRVDRVGEPSEMEKQMLEFAHNGDKAGSPLTYQLTIRDKQDGCVKVVLKP